MNKSAYFCLLLAAVLMFSACGKKDIPQAGTGETVVKKEAKAREDFKPETNEMKNKADFDKDGITVNVTGISYEERETKINLSVKNDADAPLIVMTTNFSINGLMSTESFFSEIPAKTTKEDGAIVISNSWLADMGITMNCFSRM